MTMILGLIYGEDVKKLTPEEQLLKEAKKLVWDIQNSNIIRSDGLKKAIERVDNRITGEE